MLSRHFRRTFLRLLRGAYRQGKLRCRGPLASLADPAHWQRWLEPLERTEWVVYAKPPFGGPSQVLKYLARYTHRVAISNQRLVAVTHGQVTFRWKDYAQAHRPRTIRSTPSSSSAGFCSTASPKAFSTSAIMASGNRRRADALARLRQLLGPAPPPASDQERLDEPAPRDTCPQCCTGRLVVVLTLAPVDPSLHPARSLAWNTS